jgi:hypothetical protein
MKTSKVKQICKNQKLSPKRTKKAVQACKTKQVKKWL